MEHAISGLGKRSFSEEGDSGALVLDRMRQVVGILFGCSQRKNVSYFTHAADLVEDIKSVTGAVGVRVMGGVEWC